MAVFTNTNQKGTYSAAPAGGAAARGGAVVGAGLAGGRGCHGGRCWAPGRSTAAPRPSGWRWSSGVRRPICWPPAWGRWRGVCSFSRWPWGSNWRGALAAAVAGRWLSGGNSRTAAWAGGLTLLAIQALGIFLAGGILDPGQTVATGCTALLAAGIGWAFLRFPVQQPGGACLWLAVGTACLQRCTLGPLAPGLALAGCGGALRGHRRKRWNRRRCSASPWRPP